MRVEKFVINLENWQQWNKIHGHWVAIKFACIATGFDG